MSRHYVVGVIKSGNKLVVLENGETQEISFPECRIELGEAFDVAAARNFYNNLGLEVEEMGELGRQEFNREGDDVHLYFTHFARMRGNLDSGQLNTGRYRWADVDEVLDKMDHKMSVDVPLETKRFIEDHATEKTLPAGINYDMAFA